MNKAFEKILDMLEEERELSYADFSRYVEEVSPCLDDEHDDFFHRGLERASRLVREVAEEYNCGWIPCSDRLPDDFMSMEYLTTVKGHFYPEINYYCVANHKWFSSRKTTKEVDVIAWQPLPNTFKERE